MILTCLKRSGRAYIASIKDKKTKRKWLRGNNDQGLKQDTKSCCKCANNPTSPCRVCLLVSHHSIWQETRSQLSQIFHKLPEWVGEEIDAWRATTASMESELIINSRLGWPHSAKLRNARKMTVSSVMKMNEDPEIPSRFQT